ncbi:hypothetical protein ACOSP7_026692 [Xanthoceras sorbifolium]
MATKRPQRTLPKSNRGAKIPEEFLNNVPSKRARITDKALKSFVPEDVIPENVEPLNIIPAPKLKAVSSESVQGSEQGTGSLPEFHRPPIGAGGIILSVFMHFPF